MPEMISIPRKPRIVGVMGSHGEDPEVRESARLLGEAIARRGHILLTGGGTGLMRAASEGAYAAGGLVIGILPNDRQRPMDGYPNEFVDIAVFTGMYDARNVINAKTPHCLIALAGGAGTLSEIALALRAGTPVIGFGCPEVSLSGTAPIMRVASLEEALQVMDRILAGTKSGNGTY
jgi:uncharacterized protein (TIGR00725 family)